MCLNAAVIDAFITYLDSISSFCFSTTKISHPSASQVSSMTMFVFLSCVYWLASQVSSQDTLRPGYRLNSSSQLVSAKGFFTLSFYTPYETNTSYLAIQSTDRYPVYAGSGTGASRYVVWIGNRESPVSNNSDPVLSIDIAGKMIITSNAGKPIEVFAGGSGKNVTATLLDTGNFIVKEMSSNGEVLWQSFDHPTDVLLPGMKLGVNHRTGRNWTLTSWFGPDNPAPGAFTMEWDPITRRLLIRRRGMVYWTSGEMINYNFDNHYKSTGFENFLNPMDAFNLNYNIINVTSHDEEYFSYSILIIPDQTPEERKVVAGWRLYYEGDMLDPFGGRVLVMSRPASCYGYNNKGFKFQGCELWEQPKCRNYRQTFELRLGIFWTADGLVASPMHDGNSSLSLSDCRDLCWKDCECVGYDDTSTSSGCTYWKGKRLKFEQSLDGSGPKKYILVQTTSGKKRHAMIILVVISTLAVLILGIGFFLVRKIKQGKRKRELQELLTLEGYTQNIELENEGPKSHDLRMFTYASIQSATHNFSTMHKLGQGGFGPVYKGKMPEGQDIAVKVLSQQSRQGLLEFKTELILISKLQHVNLVKLVGFCIHGNDKMIIYDYMPNKSLDFSLFSPSKRMQLDWQQRFNIIVGIAEGLLYLHMHSRLKIIHRDLKPGNILLDQNMNPKISDFGLARIFKQNVDEAITSRCAGTLGYMAPEYAMQGTFSLKSDVYSFGVLVLGIVSGRKTNSFDEVEGPLNLVEHAWELWQAESAVELMDKSLRSTFVIDELIRCIHVGLLCVESHPADRPSVDDVLSMLKMDMEILPKPQNPAYITRKKSEVEEVERSTPEKKMSSANELTISELGGR